jgi:biotin carboxyl carrier protein
MRLAVSVGNRIYRLELEKAGRASAPHEQHHQGWMCLLDGRQIAIDVMEVAPGVLSILRDGRSVRVNQERAGDERRVSVGGVWYRVLVQDARSLASKRRASRDDAGAQKLTAAMPGKVVRVLAHEGDKVTAGQGIVVVEAMKMQNEVRSPKEGLLKKLVAHTGMNVIAGDVLAVVE